MSHVFSKQAMDSQQVDRTPLVVDLDGTLVGSDLLYETFFDAAGRGRLELSRELGTALTSKQALKGYLASRAEIDFERLPYNSEVIDFVTKMRREGRPVYLATASDRRLAEGVAKALGLFDGVLATDATINLKGAEKARVLIAEFGDGGFDYIGNDASDLDIWRHARLAYHVGLSARAERKLRDLHPDKENLGGRRFDGRALIKALRPHQYAKNALVFVPLLTAHQFDLASILLAVSAFVAFSLCASGVYLLNDMVDLQADRLHPTKKKRPFASGRLPLTVGMALVPLLTVAAFCIAWFVSPAFFATLGVYYVATTLYSFSLKKRMIVDVITLALLYTLRVFAGAAAIGVSVSEWLFTFSLLVFTALALIKRYVELATRLDKGLSDPSNRNYKITDLPVIAALAAAAGMNSIMVLALYVSSDDVAAMYSRTQFLWGLCPLFLYWIARALMLAHRRMMHDDPIAFALKDDRSWVVGICCVALVFLAL